MDERTALAERRGDHLLAYDDWAIKQKARCVTLAAVTGVLVDWDGRPAGSRYGTLYTLDPDDADEWDRFESDVIRIADHPKPGQVGHSNLIFGQSNKQAWAYIGQAIQDFAAAGETT